MDIIFTEQNMNRSEVMYNAQLIADTFSKALRQNNCLSMLPIALHQELNDALRDVKDVIYIMEGSDTYVDDALDSYTSDLVETLQNEIRNSKERCFTCKIGLPDISYDLGLDFNLNKLKALFDLQLDMLKIDGFDLCQASYGLRQSCLPDILRLIVLLLTAYATIIMLKSISSISVVAFIKGVIQAILGKILGALKLNLTVGRFNVACIINALKEIGDSLFPTEDQIQQQLAKDMLEVLISEDQNNLDAMKYTDNSFAKDYSNALKTVDKNLQSIEDFEKKLQYEIDESIGFVTDVFDSAIKGLNEYLQNLVSFKLMFDCEAKRSGTDIEDVIKQVNKLMKTVNMLSAVALAIAKKDAREEMCRSEGRINELSEEDIDDLFMKDIISELLDQEVDFIDNEEEGIQWLIHEKPVESILPKIDIYQCSIDDFLEAHKLEKVIQIAQNEVRKETNVGRKSNQEKLKQKDIITDRVYKIQKPTEDQLTMINNIVNILYIKPESEDTALPVTQLNNTNTLPGFDEDLASILQGTGKVSDTLKQHIPKKTSLDCKSIDDVIGILENMRR